MSLGFEVERLLSAQVGGVTLSMIFVAGRLGLGSNGVTVLAPLMPKIEAVEWAEALRVTLKTSLEREPEAIAYHSSRFSFPA
jgi:hypothetical protein